MATPREAHNLFTRANVLLPGLYAWVTTVAYPAAERGVGVLPRLAAGVALIALAAGPWIATRRLRLGRAVGVYGFVGASALAWVSLGDVIGIERLEPVRAALGGVGWGLFAFGWGAVRRPDSVPEEDPRALAGEALPARGSLPPGAALVFVIALVGALTPILLAWSVVRTEHALLAHAAAIACALAMVTAGADLSTNRGRWRRVESSSRRLNAATTPLTALAVLAALGIVRLLVG